MRTARLPLLAAALVVAAAAVGAHLERGLGRALAGIDLTVTADDMP